ncbi:MAG: tRNA lysidine(34) synthetase TilS, partial [Burkholderiales bacterium]|nr:tRNA lysidine(34) synthetase TilS [Burkholderiales bacterium]
MAAVGVAASGGRDSTALLHACARAAAALGLEVHALHVHHGLVPEADDWLRRLRAQCRRWTAAGWPLHFHARRLSGGPAPGESVEAWARRERYRALAEMARAAGCDLVLLAQHRRDQAETLLLQALRGGGPAGLAAMPRRAMREGIHWARPWLEQPREAIEAYLRRYRLAYVDDASNADPRFARNRLRLEVWPALAQAFPDAEAQLEAAASRAQEAATCLAELAAQDLGPALEGDALRWEALPGSSEARRRNALRVGLRQLCGFAVPETLLTRLLREAPGRRAARWPAPGGELRLHQGRLRFAASDASRGARWAADGTTIDLSRPGRHDLPAWGGSLVVTVVAA